VEHVKEFTNELTNIATAMISGGHINDPLLGPDNHVLGNVPELTLRNLIVGEITHVMVCSTQMLADELNAMVIEPADMDIEELELNAQLCEMGIQPALVMSDDDEAKKLLVDLTNSRMYLAFLALRLMLAYNEMGWMWDEYMRSNADQILETVDDMLIAAKELSIDENESYAASVRKLWKLLQLEFQSQDGEETEDGLDYYDDSESDSDSDSDSDSEFNDDDEEMLFNMTDVC
jgi:hypothetical protein